jgi:hypothetical protein
MAAAKVFTVNRKSRQVMARTILGIGFGGCGGVSDRLRRRIMAAAT